MKKFIGLILILLPLALLGQRCAQAGLLGVAGDYNVFVFGDIEQWGTDVEGRVAAGGTATFGRPDVLPTDHNGFAIASRITNPANNLVVGNTVVLKNGSVGYLDLTPGGGGSGGATSQNGKIVYGASVAPVIPADVRYGAPLQNATPIDFAREKSYLTNLSDHLGDRASTGTTTILKNDLGETFQIRMDGSNTGLNVFSVLASDITQNLAFKFFAPETSTILVNVTGTAASLMNFGFYFNDVAAESGVEPVHHAAYPYSHVLFNFIDAALIEINDIAINGSILAPFAHIEFGEDSHIDGNVIAASLRGMGESHNRLFDAAIPEPGTLLLLAGGLLVLVARRRKQ